MILQVNGLDSIQQGGFSGFCWAHSHSFRPMQLCSGVDFFTCLKPQLRQRSFPSCDLIFQEAHQRWFTWGLQSFKKQRGITRELLRPKIKTDTLSHFRIHKYSPANPILVLGCSFTCVYGKFLSKE